MAGSSETSSTELRWERRARELLQRLALAAGECSSIEQALRTTLEEVCRQTGWPVGHALVRDAEGRLVSSRLWHLDDGDRYGRFREISEAFVFEAGVGLPGRVLATGRPAWIIDVANDPNFPRAKAIQDLAVRGAFGFPVHVGAEVIAVLEFFSPEPTEPDAPLLEVMATVGRQIGLVVERLRAGEALRDSELRYRSLAQNAKDAIVTADAVGDIIAWNRGATDTFGWSEVDALGRPLTILIPERLRERHERGLARVREGGPHAVIGRTVELDGLRRDGSEFPLELSLSTWETGGQRYYTGILRDITERRLAEDQLQAIAVELEQSEKRAVDANLAKSRFLAHMSHELRTPLNAILGFTQLLDRDPSIGPEQREQLGVILRSGEHLLGLINDVLSLAKIEAGHSSLQPRDFELRRVLSDAVSLMEPRARAKKLRLTLDLDDAAPPFVRGEPGKLRQVLVNLLGNAVKFTETGEVSLVVRWSLGRGRFEVSDTGPGIPRPALGTIFEPFVQAGHPRVEGTGLGLSISRSLVEVLGGSLEVDSEVGRGTRFWFELPLPRTAASGDARPRGRVIALAPSSRAPRVLIVDDDASNRLLLSRLLSLIGFEVMVAADGEQGIAQWEIFAPQLIWMDMRMPVVDGFEATRRIRAREAESRRARTIILALTASAFEDDRPAILAAGCDEIVVKPFDDESIFGAIECHLGVTFIREDEAPAAPVTAAPPQRARLAGLGPERIDPLAAALRRGDDLGARAALDAIASSDAALAGELRALVDRYEFDELLGWIEGT